MDYSETLPSYGDLMTIDEYKENVASGMFIDYDGSGHPVKDAKMARNRVKPSQCPNDIPEDATHIMWFNR